MFMSTCISLLDLEPYAARALPNPLSHPFFPSYCQPVHGVADNLKASSDKGLVIPVIEDWGTAEL